MNKYIICYVEDDNIYHQEFDDAAKAAKFLEETEYKSILIKVESQEAPNPLITIEHHT